MIVETFAAAKVNLYLHVVGRRSDGYHLLDSLVVFAGVGDTVTAHAADTLTLTIDGPQAAGLVTESDNLVLRAARRLAEEAGIAPRARLRLTKRLPVASGIGGGSADAAAALRGLTKLWRLDVDEVALHRLAVALGADVPVCLRGRPAMMQAIGETLEPAPPLPPCWLVLVNPGVGLPTAAVFKHRTAPFSPPAPLTEGPPDPPSLARALAERRNDLAAPAIALLPEIGRVLTAIEAAGGSLLTRMSGSGATCFGLYAREIEARTAADVLIAAHPEWWVAAAPIESV